MTEPAYLTEVRAAYDTVADDYAALLRDEHARDALSRPGHAGDLLRVGPRPAEPRVADLGYGPGRGDRPPRRWVAHCTPGGWTLTPHGRASPGAATRGLRFEVGTLADLDVPDAALAGVVAWYSSIPPPLADLPAVLAEPAVGQPPAASC